MHNLLKLLHGYDNQHGPFATLAPTTRKSSESKFMNTPLIKTALLLTAIALTSLTSYAGGYHCKLNIEAFEQRADGAYELKVSKIEQDRIFYLNSGLAEWEMLSEKVGRPFILVFKPTALDAKSKECLAHIKQSHKNKAPVEFGFGMTAKKAASENTYLSTEMTYFHKTVEGDICVHGN